MSSASPSSPTVEAHPDIFSPVTLGPMQLRNRIIKAATSEGRSPEGLVTDDLIDFHLDFIRGGAGLTTVAYCCVSPEGASAPGQILMSEKALPGLQRLTAAIHAEGGAVSAQLGHAGMVASKKITGVTAMGPSRFFNPSSMEYCREIKREEIPRVIDQFGQAAKIAVEAGFDAVELHFGHNYLPSSFLSPLLNRRKDEYGGSIENRARFVREISQRVRQAVGNRVAVIAKISMDDGLPGSIWLTESIRTAQLMDQDRTLDAIELTQGSSIIRQMYLFRGDVPVSEFAAVVKEPMKTGVRLFGKLALGNFPYKDLYMLEAARQFVPVMKNTKLILLGGINNLAHMNTGMQEGFDLVAMGRGLLREPDLINRIKQDHSVSSRCNHCNKCMYTVYARTHCVLEPDSHFSPLDDAESIYSVPEEHRLNITPV